MAKELVKCDVCQGEFSKNGIAFHRLMKHGIPGTGNIAPLAENAVGQLTAKLADAEGKVSQLTEELKATKEQLAAAGTGKVASLYDVGPEDQKAFLLDVVGSMTPEQFTNLAIESGHLEEIPEAEVADVANLTETGIANLADLPTKADKVRFIKQLVGNVLADLVKQADKYPKEWDGIELRWYIADVFAQVVFGGGAGERKGKRYSDYKNTIYTTNLKDIEAPVADPAPVEAKNPWSKVPALGLYARVEGVEIVFSDKIPEGDKTAEAA